MNNINRRNIRTSFTSYMLTEHGSNVSLDLGSVRYEKNVSKSCESHPIEAIVRISLKAIEKRG